MNRSQIGTFQTMMKAHEFEMSLLIIRVKGSQQTLLFSLSILIGMLLHIDAFLLSSAATTFITAERESDFTEGEFAFNDIASNQFDGRMIRILTYYLINWVI